MIVELRERAGALAVVAAAGAGPGGLGPAMAPSASEEAISALVNLGYPRPRAERVIEQAGRDVTADAPTAELIRAALRALAS